MSTRVRLDRYDNSHYSPGRGKLWRVAWMFLGLPLLRSALIPSSALRVSILRLFGAKIGEGVVLRAFSVKYPWHLIIGDHCWIGERCWIDNLTTVQLGSHVCVSQGAYFCPGSHDWTDPDFGLSYAPIYLEEAVWVGAQSILLAGAHLHEGAVVTAGSVASGHIPAWEVYSGHPARFVRKRKVPESVALDRQAVAA